MHTIHGQSQFTTFRVKPNSHQLLLTLIQGIWSTLTTLQRTLRVWTVQHFSTMLRVDVCTLLLLQGGLHTHDSACFIVESKN